MEPSYPVGYIGSLYLLDESGWPLSTCNELCSVIQPKCQSLVLVTGWRLVRRETGGVIISMLSKTCKDSLSHQQASKQHTKHAKPCTTNA